MDDLISIVAIGFGGALMEWGRRNMSHNKEDDAQGESEGTMPILAPSLQRTSEKVSDQQIGDLPYRYEASPEDLPPPLLKPINKEGSDGFDEF